MMLTQVVEDVRVTIAIFANPDDSNIGLVKTQAI